MHGRALPGIDATNDADLLMLNCSLVAVGGDYEDGETIKDLNVAEY